MWLDRVGLRNLDSDLPEPAELLDRLFRVVQRLAVEAVLVLDRLDSLALHRAGDHERRLVRGLQHVGVCAIDLSDVVAVDRDRMPSERPCALDVHVQVAPDHRLASLPEPVGVEDRRQVVERVVRSVLECLPDRALGHLAVSAQHPRAGGHAVEVLRGQCRPDTDRQALPQRSGRDVDPRKYRRRVPLELASELAVRQELVVGDRPCGEVDRVEKCRSVALREDQAIVRRALRGVEVVAQVPVDEHGHQVGCRHRRGWVARLRLGAHADRIDPKLLPKLASALGVAHAGHSTVVFPRSVAR